MKYKPGNGETMILVDLIVQGDETAFRQLFDTYYQKLFHLAISFLKSREVAEEVVADVFFSIWKKRDSLRRIDSIERYLYISVKNQALHYIRRHDLPDHDSLNTYRIELIQDSSNPESELLDQEYRTLIQAAVDSLPEKCREVFRLVLADKLKHREIAQILDISEKTVEAHIATAYKKIALYVNGKNKG